jgi:hypothetical protein
VRDKKNATRARVGEIEKEVKKGNRGLGCVIVGLECGKEIESPDHICGSIPSK